MLAMGFASGLPLALTGGTLQAWMTEGGIDIKVLGAFSLVGLPYTLKFLWAPLMDRYVPPFLGKRRGWMLISQLFLMGSIAYLGSLHPGQNTVMIAFAATLVAFWSASQDIAIDAYRAEYLTSAERGAGASVSNLGYRLAMLTSGALALILADHLSWQQVYWLMAAILLMGMLATTLGPEPKGEIFVPKSTRQLIIDPFKDFIKRKYSLEILAFIVLYKVDIVMATALTTKFMLDLGFTKTEIGAITKTVGITASIVGSLVGGVLYTKLGLRGSLWIFGIIQGLSTLSFSLLAEVGKNNLLMAWVCGFENFCAALSTAPFIAFLMALCNKRYTGTHFALFTSFAALARVFAGTPTGFLQEHLGWTYFFVVCAITALPALAILKARYSLWELDEES